MPGPSTGQIKIPKSQPLHCKNAKFDLPLSFSSLPTRTLQNAILIAGRTRCLRRLDEAYGDESDRVSDLDTRNPQVNFDACRKPSLCAGRSCQTTLTSRKTQVDLRDQNDRAKCGCTLWLTSVLNSGVRSFALNRIQKPNAQSVQSPMSFVIRQLDSVLKITDKERMISCDTSNLKRLAAAKLLTRIGLVFAACLLVALTGCNQRRYKPAKWRPAARDNSTLPTSDEVRFAGDRWNAGPGSTMPNRGTLPSRGTLPYRGTLPNRRGASFGGTLPGRFPERSWSTMPNRNGQRWSTLPRRSGIGIGNGTLPGRSVYPEYRTPQRNWSTLPTPRENVPLRNLGSTTLPKRNPLR